MTEYLAEVHLMEKFFDGFEVWYVSRLYNRDADHLAWITFSKASTPSDVIIEKLSKPSIKAVEAVSETINQDLMVIDEPEQESAVTPRCYCSSYSTSTVASAIFIQWWLQYKPNSMKMVLSTNGVGSF
jgi:hypothetical protein